MLYHAQPQIFVPLRIAHLPPETAQSGMIRLNCENTVTFTLTQTTLHCVALSLL